MGQKKILSMFVLLFLISAGSFSQTFGSDGPPGSTDGANANTAKPETEASSNGNRKQVASVTPAQSTKEKRTSVLTWADVLMESPDKNVVTNPGLFKKITESGMPWKVADKKTKIVMLLVPAGTFKMGKSSGDQEAEDTELPSHEVKLTKPFYLSETEVTQQQWAPWFANPSLHNYKDKLNEALRAELANGLTRKEAEAKLSVLSQDFVLLPVEQVSWDQCKTFCEKGGFSLPTEAQWEYACRAGTTIPRYGELDEIAWVTSTSQISIETHAVKTKAPNALGFYDMIGNVWEWCSDSYEPYHDETGETQTDPKGLVVASTDSFHVIRGGSWGSDLKFSRSSARAKQQGTPKCGNVGFRVVKEP